MRVARDITLLFLIAASLAWLALMFHPGLRDGPVPKLKPYEITLTTALSWGSQTLWIDARSLADFRAAHIPQAQHLDPISWETSLPEILERCERGQKLVVYCDSRFCGTSAFIAERLRSETGLNEVYFLHDGWAAWERHQK